MQLPLDKRLRDAPDNLDPDVWEDFGQHIGFFQRQIDEIGGEGYDSAAFAEYVLRLGIKEVPGGQFVDATLTGLQKLIGGYQSDETYQGLEAEEREEMDRRVIAMVARSQADPGFAERLETELSSIDADTHAEKIEILFSLDYEGNSQIVTEINNITGPMEFGREKELG